MQRAVLAQRMPVQRTFCLVNVLICTCRLLAAADLGQQTGREPALLKCHKCSSGSQVQAASHLARTGTMHPVHGCYPAPHVPATASGLITMTLTLTTLRARQVGEAAWPSLGRMTRGSWQ